MPNQNVCIHNVCVLQTYVKSVLSSFNCDPVHIW